MLIDVGFANSIANQAYSTKIRRDSDGNVVQMQARATALRVFWQTNMLKVVKIKIYPTTPDILNPNESRAGFGIILRPAPRPAGNETAQLRSTPLRPIERKIAFHSAASANVRSTPNSTASASTSASARAKCVRIASKM